MKLTRRQLINLIKENLNEVGELTTSGMKYNRKELERFFNKLKEAGIEIKEGTGLLKGTKVVWIDNIDKLRKLPNDVQRDLSLWRPVGRCHVYEISRKNGVNAFSAFFKSVGVKKFKVYLEAAITVKSLGDTTIYGSQIGTLISKKDHQGLFNFGIEGSEMYAWGYSDDDWGEFHAIVIPDNNDSTNQHFSKEMADLDVCNENIPSMKTLELKDLIRKPKKKGKPTGPDTLKDLAKTQVTSEPFEEDRLGPSYIKLNPIEQYSTKTGQKGVLRTKEQIEATGKSLNDLTSKFQVQKDGVNYYLVPSDYLDSLSDRDLEMMLNPEFDLD